MACDIVTSPFHETSAFEDDWQKAVGQASDMAGLGLIAEFNASCDDNTTAFDNNTIVSNSVDPQLLSASAGSPDPATDVFDQAFDQDDFAYLDFNQPAPANAPYFHSAEAPHAPLAPVFASSPLRNQLHRRSVSEPPDGFPHHHHAAPNFIPAGPPMIFTRAGHYLGQPEPHYASPRLLKSLPKSKTHRSQPYAVKAIAPTAPQGRYNLRRSQTQPVDVQPVGHTSVPQGPYMPSPPPPPPPPPHQPYSPSRSFTPASSPMHQPLAASPGAIDPALRAMTPEKKIVSIPVEELRSIITEAVRKAVEGIETAKNEKDNGGVQDFVGADAVDDEIVVASVEGKQGNGEAEEASMAV